jgi:hypothetical protein
MDRWHVGRGGQKFGPYPWAQLVEMARAGQLATSDLLWQEGTASWVPAGSFADRLPFAAGGAPPPPPPQQHYQQQPPPQHAAPVMTMFAPGGMQPQVVSKRFGFHARRAMQWNLHLMPLTEEETKELISLGVDDEDARRYHAWRRSVLWVVMLFGIVSAVLGSILAVAADHEGLSALGGFLEFLRVAAFWVIPIFAFRAARTWSRHKRSRRILAIGWSISFAVPLLLALIPADWRYSIEGDEASRMQAVMGMRALFAVGYYISLMPAVLAMIPGVMRACLRIKVLLPQSILPGCFLVGAAPLWTTLFLVVFVTINQIAGDFLLVVGVLCVAGAPILYLVHGALVTKPLEEEGERKKLQQLQKKVRIIFTIGGAFLVLWLMTANVFGKRIIGVDENAFLKPWSLDLWRFPIDYLAHSLFTMALASDLFMALNLNVWVYTKAFVASPTAKDYDRRMVEIEEAGTKE